MRKLKTTEIPRINPQALDWIPRHPIVALLDDIRSIYNVGAILRTSDAALLEKVYLTGITGTPDHRALHKTALGAQDAVPWEQYRDPVALASRLKDEGYTLAILEQTDTPSRFEALTLNHFPLCLIVGNEVHGVREKLVALADVALEIPQYGTKHSLNVAVAFGIAAYKLVDRWHDLSGTPVAFGGASPP